MSYAIKPPDWKSPIGIAICIGMVVAGLYILYYNGTV